MIMHDVGHPMSQDMFPPTKQNKNKKIYPTIRLSDKELPIMKGATVGEKLSLLILCEVKSMRKDSKDKETEYELDVLKMGEEGEMKMSKAMENAMGEHTEESDNEGAAHEKSETKAEEDTEDNQ